LPRKQPEAPTKEVTAKLKRPSTQELLTGKRSRTALMPLPLTMELPPGWGRLDESNELKLSAANVIRGITPNGEVQIGLASRRAMKQEEFDLMLKAGKKEMAEKPDEILKFEVRPLGSVQVLERQSIGKPAPLTTYDSNMVPHTTTESAFKWTVSVLVPNEGAIQVYELNFQDLTASQYEKNKDFLRGILDTLRYATDADAGPSTAPSPSPAATLPTALTP
jgi:hypothetical protein